MKSTRRRFLAGAALAISGASFARLMAQQSPKIRGGLFDPDSLSILEGASAQTFERWIGSSFRISLNGRPVGSLVLVSVDEPGTDTSTFNDRSRASVRPLNRIVAAQESEAPSTTTFSLHFQASGKALPQDTYLLSHDWLGTFPLFLVPSAPGGKAGYTATFTLLNDAARKPD
jgi:hypothetical protein